MSLTADVLVEQKPGAAIHRPWFLPRPTTGRGLSGWLTTVDHKQIGILYFITAFFFFVVGGIEALIIRTQLAQPGLHIVTADTYNQLFTMHATTMIFLAIMPLSVAAFNYLVPLMIGARDVAFPRLNAFGYWTYLAGGIILNLSWILGAHDGYLGAPNGGWFGYANNTTLAYNPGLGIDFWILGLQVLGVSSMVGALNFIVTILNMRAPGMTLMRMPVFIWMTLVTSFIIILAFPVITIALFQLMLDRMFGAPFFSPEKGGLPILWQHLFWIFGHPEVYILILPSMGIVSEILPTFSRKPLFGYPVVVFSGAVIAFMGFSVWSHHMFTTGLGPYANSAFALTTAAIAVPTGVKIFNWIGTIWGGHVRMRTPMMFAVGFIAMFMIGGFSGLMHSAPPADAQQQDTYFVVAHIHYVLIGGSLLALLSGVYYWFPKVTGRLMNEKSTNWTFWLIFVAMNITFFPMHFLGLNGMPRRIYTYDGNMGWNEWNMVCTVGAFLLALGIAKVIYDMVSAIRSGEPAGADPWDARTLEWAIPSPPPVHNFDEVPVVMHRDPLWAKKYPETVHAHSPLATDGLTRQLASGAHGGQSAALEVTGNGHTNGHGSNGHETNGHGGNGHGIGHGAGVSHGHDDHGIHMPGQSYYPALVSLGMLIGALGMIYYGGENSHLGLWTAIGGAVLMVTAIVGWTIEGVGGYHIHLHEEQA